MLSCHQVKDIPFAKDEIKLKEQISYLNDQDFPVIDTDCAQQMHSVIEAAANDGDSVGGIIETAVVGFPAGIGEPFFDSVEMRTESSFILCPGSERRSVRPWI